MTLESDSVINAPEQQRTSTNEGNKPQLRMVDLNLLTVFDAVMQEQNITRAAHVLGMSPVSYTHLTLPTICSV